MRNLEEIFDYRSTNFRPTFFSNLVVSDKLDDKVYYLKDTRARVPYNFNDEGVLKYLEKDYLEEFPNTVYSKTSMYDRFYKIQPDINLLSWGQMSNQEYFTLHTINLFEDERQTKYFVYGPRFLGKLDPIFGPEQLIPIFENEPIISNDTVSGPLNLVVKELHRLKNYDQLMDIVCQLIIAFTEMQSRGLYYVQVPRLSDIILCSNGKLKLTNVGMLHANYRGMGVPLYDLYFGRPESRPLSLDRRMRNDGFGLYALIYEIINGSKLLDPDRPFHKGTRIPQLFRRHQFPNLEESLKDELQSVGYHLTDDSHFEDPPLYERIEFGELFRLKLIENYLDSDKPKPYLPMLEYTELKDKFSNVYFVNTTYKLILLVTPPIRVGRPLPGSQANQRQQVADRRRIRREEQREMEYLQSLKGVNLGQYSQRKQIQEKQGKQMEDLITAQRQARERELKRERRKNTVYRTCRNDIDHINFSPIEEISPGELIQYPSPPDEGYCFDVNDIAQTLKHSKKNVNPFTNNDLWSSRADFNRLIEHPELDRELAEYIKEVFFPTEITESLRTLILEHKKIIKQIGVTGQILINDYTGGAWSGTYEPSVTALAFLNEKISDNEELLGLKVPRRNSLGYILATSADTCIHGVGWELIVFYLYFWNEVLSEEEVDLCSQFIRVDDFKRAFLIPYSSSATFVSVGLYIHPSIDSGTLPDLKRVFTAYKILKIPLGLKFDYDPEIYEYDDYFKAVRDYQWDFSNERNSLNEDVLQNYPAFYIFKTIFFGAIEKIAELSVSNSNVSGIKSPESILRTIDRC